MEIFGTATIRLLITFLLSLAFGLERQRSHKPVGFGTFIFVALGSCALGAIAISDIFTNSIPLIAAVVTGIGFLGAGALIRGTDKVFGFTTAASIWLFAIFGLTVGIGEYIVGGTLYIMCWLVVATDKHLEKKGIGSYQRRLTIAANKLITEKEINTKLLGYTKKYKVLSAEIDKEKGEANLTYLIEGSRESLNKTVRSLYKEEWLKSVKIE